jgi:hypothetical protein
MSGNPMSYGNAIQSAKLGNMVLRTAWAGAGYIKKVPYTYSDPTLKQEDKFFERLVGFVYVTTPGNVSSTYIPNQQDEFASDWFVTP